MQQQFNKSIKIINKIKLKHKIKMQHTILNSASIDTKNKKNHKNVNTKNKIFARAKGKNKRLIIVNFIFCC